MARPRGRTKTARISVSFEPQVYGALMILARRQDVPVAQVIRRAVAELIATQPDAEPMPEFMQAPLPVPAQPARAES